jgi:proline iminopeptidase
MNAPVEIAYVEVPGATLWTARQGSGPPVVLLHGGPGLWDYLGPVAEMIDGLATVYRYDQRACGRSSGGPPYTLDEAVADLEALRGHWGQERWILLGHSWGATLGLAYALAHPEHTLALIYMSGTGIYANWREEFHANRQARTSPEHRQYLSDLLACFPNTSGEEAVEITREYCVADWSAEMLDRDRSSELAESVLIEGAQVNWEVNNLLWRDARRVTEDRNTPERLAGCDVSTLVLHGDLDMRPAWAGQRVAEAIPGARYVPLTRAGHFTWLDDPESLRLELRRFLKEIL